MGENLYEICNICNSSMNDPRTLTCSHSFCLLCLEYSTLAKESSKCPTCLTEFEMPQGGLENLKKSEFVENSSRDEEGAANCDSCEEHQAVNFCLDCSFNYCPTCLEHHGRIPASSDHKLKLTTTSTSDKINVSKYSNCKQHLEVMTLFCEDCKSLLCGRCLTSEHNEHKIKHVTELIDSLKNKLEQDIKAKEEILKNVVTNYKRSEDTMLSSKLKALNLKKEIQKRGEDVKKAVDLYAGELNTNADDVAKQYRKDADNVLKELKNMESNLKARIETLKKDCADLNYASAAQMSLRDFSHKKDIPEYSNPFQFSLLYDLRYQTVNLRKVVGSIGIDLNSLLQTLKQLRTEEMPCIQKFKHVSEMLSFCLPALRDKSLSEIDDLFYAKKDMAAIQAQKWERSKSWKPRDGRMFATYQDVYTRIAFGNGPQNRDFLFDTAYLELLENSNLYYLTSEPMNMLLKLIFHLISTRDCFNVCFCLKIMKILMDNRHKEIFTFDNYIENLELVCSMLWLKNLSNIPQPSHKRQIASWMSRQSAAIFRKFTFKSPLMPRLKKCMDALAEKNFTSNTSRLLLGNGSDKSLMYRFDCLHGYFMSASNEEEKIDRIELFLDVIGGMDTNVDCTEFLIPGINEADKGCKHLMKQFFAQLYHLSNYNECRNEQLRNIEKHGCSIEPYLPHNADCKAAWGSNVRQLVKEKLKDSTRPTGNGDPSERSDYAIEKFLFHDEFMRKLYVLNTVYCACFMRKDLFEKKGNSFEIYEIETFRSRSSPIVTHLHELLQDPAKLGSMPWWIETTLEHCPFLFLPNHLVDLMEDLIKLLKGDAIDEETKRKLQHAFENTHSRNCTINEYEAFRAGYFYEGLTDIGINRSPPTNYSDDDDDEEEEEEDY